MGVENQLHPPILSGEFFTCINYENIQCLKSAHRYTLCTEQRWANLIVNAKPFERNKILGFLIPSFKCSNLNRLVLEFRAQNEWCCIWDGKTLTRASLFTHTLLLFIHLSPLTLWFCTQGFAHFFLWFTAQHSLSLDFGTPLLLLTSAVQNLCADSELTHS